MESHKIHVPNHQPDNQMCIYLDPPFVPFFFFGVSPHNFSTFTLFWVVFGGSRVYAWYIIYIYIYIYIFIYIYIYIYLYIYIYIYIYLYFFFLSNYQSNMYTHLELELQILQPQRWVDWVDCNWVGLKKPSGKPSKFDACKLHCLPMVEGYTPCSDMFEIHPTLWQLHPSSNMF